MDPAQLLGPLGLTVGLIIAVYAFYTGRVRPGSEVTKLEKQIKEKDRIIEVVTRERDAERESRFAERRLKRTAKTMLVDVVPDEAKPPG